MATKKSGDRRYLRIYLSLTEAIMMLDVSERGQLVTWGLQYCKYGQLPDDDELNAASRELQVLFSVMRNTIDQDEEARIQSVINGGTRTSKREDKTPSNPG